MKLGALQPQNVNRFLGIPDVERETILLNSRRDFIAKVLEDIIYKGEYQGPDPMMDLNMARLMAGDYYAFAMRLQVDEGKCQMLRDFAVECEKLPQIGQGQQSLATIQPHLQAVAGLPGAPPPGGPPPPAGPMNGAPIGQ
jgi:hypothetical protein